MNFNFMRSGKLTNYSMCSRYFLYYLSLQMNYFEICEFNIGLHKNSKGIDSNDQLKFLIFSTGNNKSWTYYSKS